MPQILAVERQQLEFVFGHLATDMHLCGQTAWENGNFENGGLSGFV